MRIFSGIQPTGRKHLGNYIGAIRQYVEGQDRGEAIYCIVDLHAITVDFDPAELRERVHDTAAILLAAGLDPERCILFRQADVREHTELGLAARRGHRLGRPQPHAPVEGQARAARGPPGRVRLRRPLQLPGAAGRRRARLPRQRGAGRRRPAPARRADARDRAALQRALRRDRWSCPSTGSPRSARGSWTCRSPDSKMATTGGTEQGTVLVLDEPDGRAQEGQERRHRLRLARSAAAPTRRGSRT